MAWPRGSAAGFAVAARLVDVAAVVALLFAAGSEEVPLVPPVARLVDVFLSSVPMTSYIILYIYYIYIIYISIRLYICIYI